MKKTGFDYSVFNETRQKNKKDKLSDKAKENFVSFSAKLCVIGFGEILILPALACSDRLATLGCS